LPDVCPLPIPDPRRVEESWTDWAEAGVIGPFTGSIALTLNHSFNVTGNAITIGANAQINVVEKPADATQLPLAAIGVVIPDSRLISVPVPPFAIPHVDKSPIFQTLAGMANGRLLMASALGFGDKLVKDTFRGMAADQQARLNATLNQYLPLTLQLPNFDNLDPASQALLKLVLDYLYANLDVIGEIAFDVIKKNWTEVLYYILTDNRAALAQLFAAQALCPGIESLKANMPSGPLYSTANGACAAVDARNPGTGPFYATASCTSAIGFQPENLQKYCSESLTAKPNPYLGNAAAWPALGIEVDSLSALPSVSSKWSVSSSTQLAVGVEPINANRIPFVKRVNFRQAGGCELEMRVYKKDIAATNLKPLLWIHGGAWTYRSSGFLGMESLVSNYTEDNFVVFAPFHRLAGDKDGNAECRFATWENIVADVEAAFDWVKANGASLGADTTSGKIAVTGQSSGAYLAAWLMTHRADQVSRGLLVYPPTDLRDFLTRLQGVGGATFPPLSDSANTPYDPGQGQEVIETFLGLPKGSARTVNLSDPTLTYLNANSLAKIIADGRAATPPVIYPPAFILHGTLDSLLTYSQSEVFCEAYGSAVNVDWLSTADLRAVFACSGDSELHLFKEAGHVFEVCPFPNVPGTCRAGSAASAALVGDSLQKGRRWLNSQLQNGVPVTGLAGAGAAELRFTFEVPAGVSNATFQLSGGTGDADLYVRYGTPPTTSTYDCRPYIDGNEEICAMPATAGTWYVMVRGYTAFANVSLVASYAASANYLQNGVPVIGLAGAAASVRNYLFQVPAGVSNATFQLSGGTGDADLYVRYGTPPTTSTYDCRPYIDGNEEICAMPATAGTWYVMVHGYSAFSGVTLVGRYQ
jgi:acetyl esterase/lipase